MLSERKPHSLIHLRIRRFVWNSVIGVWAFAGFGIASLSAETISRTVDVVATIEPEFSLSIEPATGSQIDFGILYSSPTESRVSHPIDVTVRVFSNLGRPYQVSHQLLAPITADTGASLSPEDLLFRPEGASQSRPLQGAQAQTVFTSDPRGRSATQSVSYQLRVPPHQAAGNYRGTLMMTVTAQ